MYNEIIEKRRFRSNGIQKKIEGKIKHGKRSESLNDTKEVKNVKGILDNLTPVSVCTINTRDFERSEEDVTNL